MRVRLFRDSFDTPWGFRLQGGRDLKQPLVVQRVFSNTPAEGELQRGDVFLSINGRDAEGFTHKQALDQIKFGGGQIELIIERPATPNVTPLNPQSPTRAPSNLPPITQASINIPIKKRPDPVYAAPSMPPPSQNTSGHQPKKVTLTKYGGGTTSFGSNYGKAATQPGWSPQPSPYSQQYTPQPSMMVRVQDTLDSALSPKASSSYQTPPLQQGPPLLRQFSAGSPYSAAPSQSQSELQDAQPSYIRSSDPVPEEDYTYIPVSQRKQTFQEKPRQQPVPKGKKGPTPFKPQSSEYTNFGVDYTKIAKQPEVQRFQPSVAAPPPPPPVQAKPARYAAADDGYDGPPAWSNTLRASDIPKPWELEQQDYIMPAQRGPPVSPKPTSPARPPQPPQQRQIPVRMSSTATSSPAATTKTGERDWSESHVYRMLHDQPPAPAHGAPMVNTKPPPPPMAKPAPPAPPAPRQQQYQAQPQQNHYDRFDDTYGTSDF